MKAFILGLAQMQFINATTVADKERNLKKADTMLENAHKAEVDLVCLPEFFSVGCWLSVGKPKELIEPFMGPTNLHLAKLAEEYNLYICGGSFPTERPDGIYNMGAFITPKKIAGAFLRAYDRPDYYKLDTKFPFFKTPLGKIGIVICGDIFVPEISRGFMKHDVELVLNPTMNAVMYYDRFMAAARSRAFENCLFVAQCNPLGYHPAWGDMIGGSTIFNPEGIIVESAPLNKEFLLTSTLQPNLKIQNVEWQSGREFLTTALQSIITKLKFTEIICK
ncbi:MAG: carbon-nitrogen hydrolase family protein [Candidatus Helarchaeota archaeon]